MRARAYGATVLAAAAVFWLMGGTQREKAVVTGAEPAGLRTLETAVVTAPGSVESRRALAQAYLDARQPGLAVAALEAGPPTLREDVRVRHILARALVDEGRSEEALHLEESVAASCGPLARGEQAPEGCDPVVLASALRRAGILRELVALGVEDAPAHPEAMLFAYENATREARVAVE